VFTFDYTASAELFAAQGRARLRYRRFARPPKQSGTQWKNSCLKLLSGTSIEVNDKRYTVVQSLSTRANAILWPASIPQCEGATSYLIRSG
jgi:hypothetical protein